MTSSFRRDALGKKEMEEKIQSLSKEEVRFVYDVMGMKFEMNEDQSREYLIKFLHKNQATLKIVELHLKCRKEIQEHRRCVSLVQDNSALSDEDKARVVALMSYHAYFYEHSETHPQVYMTEKKARKISHYKSVDSEEIQQLSVEDLRFFFNKAPTKYLKKEIAKMSRDAILNYCRKHGICFAYEWLNFLNEMHKKKKEYQRCSELVYGDSKLSLEQKKDIMCVMLTYTDFRKLHFQQ
jgi:hypothetical protein